MAKARRRPRPKRQELAVALKFGREHDMYRRFVAANDDLVITYPLLDILIADIEKYRDELDAENAERKKKGLKPKQTNLAFVVGTRVRDIFGHKWFKRRRKLTPEEEARAHQMEDFIKACEGLIMKVFSERQKNRKKQKEAAEGKKSVHPIHTDGQFRLT